MASLALQEASPGVRPDDFIAAFWRNDRYEMYYLLDEVLPPIPNLQTISLHAATLDRLTAPLCD